MIHDLKPYPAYKNSGVPWLGQVPEHWGVQRGKCLFNYRKEINVNRSNSNILSLTLRGVVNNNPDDPEGLVPKDYGSYQIFKKGDLVFKLIDLENLRTSRVGLVHEDGIMSPAYVRLTPQTIGDIRFFYHQYFDLYQRGIYNQLGAGVRSTLGPIDLLNLNILVPPLTEQSAIVRYLDYMDRRIRRYIHAKQKLIKLLEEQKQAIIHRAVTRGLDPNVKLKPSGVEWLGDVPEHWSIISLGSASALIQTGPFGSQLHSYEYIDDGIPVINPSHMKNGRIVPDKSISITPEKSESLQRHKIQSGDIVAARRGELGRCALVTSVEEGWICGTGSLRICCKPSLYNSSYLLQLLSSQGVKDSLSLSSIGATMDNLNSGMVARLLLPLPSIEEQHQIEELIHETNKMIDTIVTAIYKEIFLMREYRIRLIADVVTGKLDVREAAASLPDEVEEPEVLEDTSNKSEEIMDIEHQESVYDLGDEDDA